MKFTSHRNMVVTSTLGHTIEFKKGEPTHVPLEMHQAVIEKGAIPEEHIEEAEIPPSAEPTDPAERKAKIFEAFAAMVLRGDRESFTGTGLPQKQALASQLGFILDNKERDALWHEYQLSINKDE